ncbi:MAG TPA: mandelate racemase/muconate lactonizing enzyme family protein [Terriglobales bacterium]|jgi:L-alanine-DL-glutamate epimerase-like enolase superfamily enzyme|nr:mandelate racemase/muconate lactonizing enzyme family protein [Terriglobales bacterium]
MRLTRVETIAYQNVTEVHAGGVGWLWVRIHTDSGHYGTGETFPAPDSDKSVILKDFAPVLLGRDPRDIERIWLDLFTQIQYRGWAGAEMRAISAIDVALWDLLGKSLDCPAYVLLGGKCWDSIPIYNTCYDSEYDFNKQPAELAKSLVDVGITGMKIWPFDRVAIRNRGQSITSAEMAEAIAPVQRIREAVGNQMQIMMEFHGFWNVPCAIQIAQALEPYDITWLEEMLPQDNIAAYEVLARQVKQPLCISERLMTRWGYRELLERRVASVVMPDLAWCGGLTEAKKIAAAAHTQYLPVAFHNCAGPITHFASWHLSMATPNLKILETVRRHYTDRYPLIVTANGAPENGRLGVPPGPGLGVELKPEFLRSGRVQIESVDEQSVSKSAAAWHEGKSAGPKENKY